LKFFSYLRSILDFTKPCCFGDTYIICQYYSGNGLLPEFSNNLANDLPRKAFLSLAGYSPERAKCQGFTKRRLSQMSAPRIYIGKTIGKAGPLMETQLTNPYD
jgi:hypothetical protein